jgi:GNAT superfamily N-acetyltransferase
MAMKDLDAEGLAFSGYFPGVVGKITEIHAVYYYENWGFDISFETQVGRELSEFLENFQERRDGFWVATMNGEFAGSIAIDGRQAQEGRARLRWFIVSPKFQGRGIGTLLMRKAIDFCREAGFKTVYLWTFEGLDEARAVYEQVGFRFSKEQSVRQWGQAIKEQMFQLEL